ncbi:hypothetical protein BDN67DRAFT_511386 [Paxillus ammoniavirescens]|nr:hypothetical protein BDN67DRAFT_511386 [Paxillus ammoniavirescens]
MILHVKGLMMMMMMMMMMIMLGTCSATKPKRNQAAHLKLPMMKSMKLKPAVTQRRRHRKPLERRRSRPRKHHIVCELNRPFTAAQQARRKIGSCGGSWRSGSCGMPYRCPKLLYNAVGGHANVTRRHTKSRMPTLTPLGACSAVFERWS